MSLFKRLLNPNYKSEEKAKKSDQSKYYPEEKLPTDEKFTYNFNKNGGKFLYCENQEEVSEAFDNILLENDWYERDVFCINDQLTSRFDGYNLNFSKKTNATFFLSTCESLVANNGSILLSSNQIKEKKLKELPSNFIIFATTSQLVENISEGLRKIKNQSQNHIPSNITTIQDFETEKEKDFMSYGSSTKNLYLLLLEDL
ncbi:MULTISPECIES: LUD domain-containing protein [Altibacter]|uniref:LUD domain-containing protein n=1 Tax=Altibacter TaxID=1535231 RepID=UPI00055887EB|nr:MULTISPECIES: LUD domain-containing protein [Altibacter]MCW8980519.1 LUD domain-containing protein [Altibacter sp.]MCW9037923.1 LUD domain-containing protein [Altibacter sp.]